jgi:Flp pilus assembly pilin Flp
MRSATAGMREMRDRGRHMAFRFAQLRAALADTRGANMVEYIILVGVVAILAMAGFKYFGHNVNNEISLQGNTVGNIQSQ